MKDLIILDVEQEGSTYWKVATIKKTNGGGLCAISNNEPIYSGIYYLEGEVFYTDVFNIPKGSSKVMSVCIWFNHITNKENTKILIECENIGGQYEYKYPLNIKLKENKRKHKKRGKKLV